MHSRGGQGYERKDRGKANKRMNRTCYPRGLRAVGERARPGGVSEDRPVTVGCRGAAKAARLKAPVQRGGGFNAAP